MQNDDIDETVITAIETETPVELDDDDEDMTNDIYIVSDDENERIE